MSNLARSGPDRCPGVIAVHQAADGGLARIRLPGGVLTATQLRVLSAAATDLGDGQLELTSRANLQLRGLAGSSLPELSQRLYEAGLLPSLTHERVRNILTSPLSGLDAHSLYDVLPLTATLDQLLCATPVLADLPGRFLFALDDGRGDVADLADAAIRAVSPERASLWLAGTDTGVLLPYEVAPATLIATAQAFLAERTAQSSAAWRLAELIDGPARILTRLSLTPPTPQTTSSSASPGAPNAPGSLGAMNTTSALGAPAIGAPDAPSAMGARAAMSAPDATGMAGAPDGTGAPGTRTATGAPGATGVLAPRAVRVGMSSTVDGRTAVVAAVPLGRLTASQALALADLADDAGGVVRVAPWRSVVVPDVAPSPSEGPRASDEPLGPGAAQAPEAAHVPGAAGAAGASAVVAGGKLLQGLDRVGLVVDAGSAWIGMTGCAGRPGCAKAHADVRADAAAALPLLLAGKAVHWSGCERRCGRPGGSVDVVATGNGYQVDGVRVDDVTAAVAARRTDA